MTRALSSSPAPIDPAWNDTAERDLGRLFQLAWAITIALLIGLGIWARASSVNGAVISTGTIAVEGKRKAVQHLDGGTVAVIHVKEGARVEAGAPIASLDDRELVAELAGVTAEIAARSKQIASIENELEGLLDLHARKLVANNRVTGLQREATGLAADVARLSNQKAKVEARLARIVVHAPVAGWVHNLAIHTVGGLIQPGATIAEMVPVNDGLIVEARIVPSDVDQIRPSQAVSVRMTSFNQRTTPSLNGHIDNVSADLLRDELKGYPYYLARIVIADAEKHKLGSKVLVPGMPAEVLIETERRSVMSYLTKPLTDQIMRAFREE